MRSQLLAVSHYHQRPGCHPSAHLFENGQQCFELITSGRGWVETDGEWKEATPGTLLWHIPGDRTIGRSDFNDPYSCLAVRFYDGEIRKRRVSRITRWEEMGEVRRFTQEVVQLHADESFDSQVLLRYIISRLHFQAELHMRSQKERGLPVELRRAMELVNLRHAEPLRLRELARAAGWSVPHLHDKFKEHLGLSPHQALIRRRIQAARELLAGTRQPIKSVAAN
ncbi:MAG: AraC family transcriptional regulator [Methylacidiphilales bacterium]|nr:AraC family transcriptional regulator [Candidatus Methylacidiphilales bacterium]